MTAEITIDLQALVDVVSIPEAAVIPETGRAGELQSDVVILATGEQIAGNVRALPNGWIEVTTTAGSVTRYPREGAPGATGVAVKQVLHPNFVYVLDASRERATKRHVVIGRTINGRTVIVEGLVAGEEVVVEGGSLLRGGGRIAATASR
jgi:multidrug efflux pump subunit AcrA (membrane-fusion protein)